MVGKNPPINGPNYDGYKSRWGYFLMGKPRWVRLHDGYKSMMSIPRWAFVIEKMCDGQIADGEYPGNPRKRKQTELRDALFFSFSYSFFFFERVISKSKVALNPEATLVMVT